jgi:branched-chain amino acid transport system substrate-binding protein
MTGRRSLLALALAALPFAAQAQGQTAPPTPVKLGVLTDFSSIFTDYTGKGSMTAIQMAVDDFGGKVLGRPIQILSADHQNKPDVALTIVREWFDRDKVDALLDVGNSGIAAAVGALASERDKVMMTGAVSSDLTGKFCSPATVQFVQDSYSEAHVPAADVLKAGGDSWYFLTADYALGYALERDGRAAAEGAGGKVLGSIKTPFGTSDFSSFLLSAQNSGAKVIDFSEAGKDLTNSLKQAAEFGLVKDHIFVAPHLELLDAKSVGLETMGGTFFTEAWYWDQDDASRAFAKRFFDQRGYMPLRAMASLYSATLHYLKAVQAVGSAESGRKVIAQMQATPVNDIYAKNGHLRPDGRLVKDMFVAQVKTPAESKGPWDLYKLLRTVPADQAFRPLSQSECPTLPKG